MSVMTAIKLVIYSAIMIAVFEIGMINLAAAIHGYNLPLSLSVGLFDLLALTIMIAATTVNIKARRQS